MGLNAFAARAVAASLDGVIVPDLPPEESGSLQTALCSQGIDLIFLVAPTQDSSRIAHVASHSSGFLYLVSLAGVTGSREQLAPDLGDFVARVQTVTDLPLAVGFGISTPDQAARVACLADGVIVGSALLAALGSVEEPVLTASRFISSLRRGLDIKGH
jgi:tryptophan synthase alpha chain